MGRPGDWRILDMDRDPTPGDPQRVRQLSERLHEFADDVETALRLVRGMQSDEAVLSWAGLSADAFRDEFGSTPKNLGKLHSSYRMAAEALEVYWPQLDRAQNQADRALAQGRTAHAQLASAQGGLGSAQDWLHTATATADGYDPARRPGAHVPPPDSDQVRQATRDLAAAKARQAQAQQAVTTAQSALDAAKRLAEQARGLREDAARRTVAELHRASDAGIHNRHWWQKAVHWVADHWDEIVTVCKWVTAILGIVVMIIGGPLAWLVVAAAVVVLADTVAKYLQGKASLWDVLFAALDCIPMTKGLTSLGRLSELYRAGGLLRIGAEGLKGAVAGLRNTAAAVRGLGAGARIVAKGLPDALRGVVKIVATPEGLGVPVADLGGIKVLMSEAAKAAGAGRNIPKIPASAPNDRHMLDRIRPKMPRKEANSVVLPHVDVGADVDGINAGQAVRDGNDYVINGRTYRVEGGHTYPVSGDGIVQLDRGSYRALQLMIEAGGKTPDVALQLQREKIDPGQISLAEQVLSAHRSQR